MSSIGEEGGDSLGGSGGGGDFIRVGGRSPVVGGGLDGLVSEFIFLRGGGGAWSCCSEKEVRAGAVANGGEEGGDSLGGSGGSGDFIHVGGRSPVVGGGLVSGFIFLRGGRGACSGVAVGSGLVVERGEGVERGGGTFSGDPWSGGEVGGEVGI